MSVLASWDSILANMRDYGPWRRAIHLYSNEGGTAPTATLGGQSQFKRFTTGLTVPSMGAGVLGAYLLQARASSHGVQTLMAEMVALEYELGSLNFATGVFTDGVAMPTKRYSGRDAVQSASQLTLLVPTASLTAVTPTVEVTYTNQDGATGQVASIGLPTNALVSSGFSLNGDLAAGDTGMRDVTGMTKSAGTVGTLKCYGYLILATTPQQEAFEPLRMNYPMWLCEAGDRISFLEQGSRSISNLYMTLLGVAET